MSNLLILLSDEHNPLYSSPYGHPSVQTPHMQALADRGTVFDAAYCPSPLCMPCRSAFMSGQRVHQIQTYNNCNALVDPSPISFGAALAQQGAYSAYIGKTDVYAPAKDLGFSEMMQPRDRCFPGDTNHGRHPVRIRKGASNRANGYGAEENAGSHDIEDIDRAIAWLNASTAQQQSPWVLVVNVGSPHFPHIVPPKFWDMYPQGDDLPRLGPECETAQHPHAQALRRFFETEKFTEKQIRGLRRGYLASISFLDEQLGRLMQTLDTTGLGDTTNLVYTSDHGEMLGKFGMWWKCSLYEDSVRIPMIAAGPDFSQGQHTTTPVDLHDLQASMFHATRTQQPSAWQGSALQNIPIEDAHRIVFSEYHGHGTQASSYMIRKGEWKYLYYVNAPAQLFNLKNDPEELVNLASVKPTVVAELDVALRNICSPEAQNDRADQFTDDQLKSIVGVPDSPASLR